MTHPGAAAREQATGADAVDWALAQRRVTLLTRPGPEVDREQLGTLVASLRLSAERAPAFVGSVTGLGEAAQRAERGATYVIDRPRWAHGNLEMLRRTVGDLLPAPKVLGGRRVAAEELGLVLSLLAGRVLGQFDPFAPAPADAPAGTPAGRLVLVAPNVLQVQRDLGVEPGDFHLWVCLHEQTHALQFAAAPWLGEHLLSAMRAMMSTLLAEEEASARLRNLLEALPRVIRGDEQPVRAGSGGALLGAVLTESEQAAMDEVVAIMSLLEGHADVVMDAVGPRVVPSVRKIRRAFEARRGGQGLVDTVLRRVLGLDAKLAQYREGGAFVRTVVDRVGHAGLNAVWTGAHQLPRAAEIADPGLWVRRVHG